MAKAKRKTKKDTTRFLGRLSTEQLTGLAAQLHELRNHPPLTKRSDGKYEGDILGFVKGLRFSAGVIYFLRERLSGTGLDVSWGHIVNKTGQYCSAECDIIVHEKGYIRKWNGSSDPVMEFRFVEASKVKAVISCKSLLNSVDNAYAVNLRQFGVKHVFVMGECCAKTRVDALRRLARRHGYKGLWVLYHPLGDGAEYDADGEMHEDFADRILRTVTRGRTKKAA